MKCYNHHDRDAFGVCKICGKGLCLECIDKDSEVVICAKEHGRTIISDKVLNILFIIVGLYCFVSTVIDEFDFAKILLGIVALSIGIGGFSKSKKKS